MSGKRPSVSPFLVLVDPAPIIRFLEEAFDGQLVTPPLTRSDGSIWNAEIQIGDGVVFISGARSDSEAHTGFVHLYVDDCDRAYDRAIALGATSMMAPCDQFYGDRAGGVVDQAGNIWWIATQREDLARDELERRARAFEAQMSHAEAMGASDG